jgi:RNA polymerase sigma factor (sigma-70 family)
LLAVIFLFLLVREAYVPPTERLWAEFVTALMIPPLAVLFDTALGAFSPSLLVPIEILAPRIGPAAVAIALFRYNTAPETRPDHRYKRELKLHHRTWYFNDLFIVGGFAYLATLEFAAPAKSNIQYFFTNYPAVMCFASAIRLQLNPLGGRYRHQRIDVTLLTDPDEADILMMRDYLLTGADWLRNFGAQSLLEMLSFVFAFIPLLIPVWQWHTGDANAARIHWSQLGVSAGSWLVLLAVWPCVKEINRQTRRVLNQTAQTFGGGPKNNCKDLGTSTDISSERTDMRPTDKSDKDQTYQQQFAEMFRNHRRLLYLAALKITGHHQNAEDTVQSVFADLLLRRYLDKPIENPIGYVHGTTVHKALDAFDKQMHEKRTLVSNTECQEMPAPENISQADDRIEYQRVALAKMKPELVKLLNLCCVEELPCIDVAKMLRKPVGTVYADLWRAKHQVRKLIRIQEKRDEAQKNKHQGISKPGLADPSGAGD